jgi:hypothetical protein
MVPVNERVGVDEVRLSVSGETKGDTGHERQPGLLHLPGPRAASDLGTASCSSRAPFPSRARGSAWSEIAQALRRRLLHLADEQLRNEVGILLELGKPVHDPPEELVPPIARLLDLKRGNPGPFSAAVSCPSGLWARRRNPKRFVRRPSDRGETAAVPLARAALVTVREVGVAVEEPGSPLPPPARPASARVLVVIVEVAALGRSKSSSQSSFRSPSA